MTRWYRAYEGTVTDPKLAEAAAVAGCSRSVAIAAWHLTLENAATTNDGGRIDIPSRRIAAALCEPLSVVEALMSAFADIGLVVGSHVAAWNRRQFVGDKSTERVQRHRAKKSAEKLPRNQDETGETVTETKETVPETHHRQRQNTEGSEANASGAVAPKLSASDITKAIFDTGIAILTSAGHPERQARSIIGRWRKEFTDPEVLSVLSRCADDVSEPVEWVVAALQFQREKSTGATDGQRFQRTRFNSQSSDGLFSVAHSVIADLDPTYFDPPSDEGGSGQWAPSAPSWEDRRDPDQLPRSREAGWHGRR